MKQCDPAVESDRRLRNRRSQEPSDRIDRHFARLDDPVAVRVVEGENRAIPEPEQRVPRHFPNFPVDDGRDADAQGEQLVRITSYAELRIDPDTRRHVLRDAQQRLEAAVLHRSDVLEARRRDPVGRREPPVYERVVRLLVVVGQLEPRRIMKQSGVDARLELRRALRLERAIAKSGEVDPGHVGWGPAREDRCGLSSIEEQSVRRPRLLPRGSVCEAQLQIAHREGTGVERLVRDHPRAFNLGIDDRA